MSNSERIRPPWWLKCVNKAMIGVHRLGLSLGDKGPVVLTVPGRKSGKPRSTPVTPMSGVGFMKNAGLVTGPNPDEFEALAGRCPVFRLDPVNI